MDCGTNKYNLTIWQGSTFGFTLQVQDPDGNNRDLSDYSAVMQIRSSYDSATATESLSSSNGEIVISGANLSVQLSSTRTANIYVDLNGSSKPPKTTYVYDLELTDNDGIVSKLLYGDVNVYGEVTR